ncbi:MAG: phospholipase D family protein [Candidatus Bathyarchaeia archaeon]
MRSYLGTNVGTYIENQLLGAKKYVKICSPWISPIYASRLVDLAKRGVNVWVMLQIRGKPNSQNETFDVSRKSYNILKEKGGILKRVIGFLKKEKTEPILRIIAVDSEKYGFDLAHAKIYVVDGEYAVVGSVNLTETGLWKNLEYILVFEGSDAKVIEEDYDRLWRAYYGGLR